MDVITVMHEKQVLEPHIMYCCASPAEAANDFRAKFGINPETVYQKVAQSGRSTCYIPAPDSVLENFSNGAYYGIDVGNPGKDT